MNAQNIKNTQDLVEDILINSRAARNSDNVLILEVYNRLLADKGMDITRMTFPMVLINIKNLGLPSLETVGRCRRKLQEDHLDLRSDKDIAEAREELQQIFREYALS